MTNWLLQTLSEILQRQTQSESQQTSHEREPTPSSQIAKAHLKADREWCAAIAALQDLLLENLNPDDASCQGLILSAPTPVLSHPSLLSQLQTGIFSAEAFHSLALMPFQLPGETKEKPHISSCSTQYPLIPNDPLANEQFCLVFTPQFSLVLVLGEDSDELPCFKYSFDPDEIQQCWQSLRSRLLLTGAHHLPRLEALIETFAPIAPDYRLVTHFSHQILKHLPKSESTQSCTNPVSLDSCEFNSSHSRDNPGGCSLPNEKTPEVELLQALTHEVRTPLTTIRMLTRLLLKRRDLTPDVIKRLEMIDQECTEQINRMELIFRATELETQPSQQERVQLAPISLEQLFQQSIPRWKKQAQRRNVDLDVLLPNKLPRVVSDPAMLDSVLTGLMEKFTRSLPNGGEIRVQVTTAGNQLKLQLLSHCSAQNPGNSSFPVRFTPPQVKSLGQLLMFQPETGSLSLNLNVTKNLFNALGGKLIVRHRPEQGEVFTIFLPLGNSQPESDWNFSKCEV